MKNLPLQNATRLVLGLLVFATCAMVLLALLYGYAEIYEDFDHLEHHCFTEEEFLSWLTPPERTLYALGGTKGISYGYAITAALTVIFGLWAIWRISRKKAGPESP